MRCDEMAPIPGQAHLGWQALHFSFTIFTMLMICVGGNYDSERAVY